MSIQIEHLTYNGNNIKFLEMVINKLGKRSTGKSILYRTSEQESLEKILRYGTDRGGFPGRKLWGYSEVLSREVLHEDVIFATTEEEIKYGEMNERFQTSLKKFSLIKQPLLLVYDADYFVKIAEKQYAFKNSEYKLSSLLAVFIVDKEKSKI